PDHANQLGFTKGAQTYDHVFTLNTIVSKYKKLGKRVFAVFVDLKKAFDSVCREALFLKLAQAGICGKFYNVLRHMYSNSTSQIKLSGHISNTFSIRKGTEQGHPLSPDLFKLFLHDLSPMLECENCPQLIDKIISHLLWADDLIILALDELTLQKQLSALHDFCTKWGIHINVDKTKLMVFNKKCSRMNTKVNNTPKYRPQIGNQIIEEVESYCYLGLIIHNSGNVCNARVQLKKKAMRALYSLKSTVNKTKLTFKSLCNLFDALIKPIALYGAPIWTPSMSLIKHLVKNINANESANNDYRGLMKKIALINCEKVHLNFLKWSLGVNKRASNIGSWGEPGRYPLIYECLRSTLNYIRRIQCCDPQSFVSLAYQEQQKLRLDWYKHIEPILNIDPSYTEDHVTAYHHNTNDTQKCINPATNATIHNPSEFLIHNGFIKIIPKQTIKPIASHHFNTHTIINRLHCNFKKSWHGTMICSTKLDFYKSVKSEFNPEPYLYQINNFYDRSNVTKLRISAHELEIELGRRRGLARNARHCKWCNISMGLNVVEDEKHLLFDCDLYVEARQKIIKTITSLHNYHTQLNSNQINCTDLLLRNITPWHPMSSIKTRTTEQSSDTNTHLTIQLVALQ
ncbi:MAG: reverse transcriptase family protein, partial [Saccharospirillaceae bacterium]|nr:reverse transcriptase family protein [Saccharospirillaceae bacterium]